jgi:hypothetical protein
MAKFGHKLAGRVAKIQNRAGAVGAKVDIRSRVLAAVGAGARVFDAFAGAGEMHDAVWRDAAGYAGCDQRWFRDDRLCWVADNRRVLRSIDLAPYSIFDLDAWGSPWEQALIIAARRAVVPGEKIGMVLTEGSGMRMKQGHLPKALAQIAGLDWHVAGTARLRNEIIDRAVAGLARKMACHRVHQWQAAGKNGSAMLYLGVVLRGGQAA